MSKNKLPDPNGSTEQKDNTKKTAVSSEQSDHIKKLGGVLVGILALGVLVTLWFNQDKKEEIKKEPLFTAAQMESRRDDIKIEESKEASDKTKQRSFPSENGGITQKSNLDRVQQQQRLARLESAQKRLIAPTSVYRSSSSTKDSEEPTFTSGLNDSNSRFGNRAANQPIAVMDATQETLTDFKIFQGKIIPALLDTAINSDLAGMVRATISEDVYGETGRNILLPKGSRLIGNYNSDIVTGQGRVYIIWTRAITPHNVSIRLASPGIDGLGRGGMGGAVDNHFWEIFGTSMLLSIMAAGVADIETDNSDTLYGNPYQFEVVESFTGISDQILSNRLNIKPTITIDQGEPVRVMVAQDLDFSTLPHDNAEVVYDPNK